MRITFYKAALVAILAVAVMPIHAALGDDRLQGDGRLKVVAFGDSLLDAGTYSPFAAATFGGGRFTTNPGLNFTQDVAHHFGDMLTPAFLGGFGVPLYPAGGLDYAQGGSRVTMQPGIGHAPGAPDFAEATTIPVQDQVNTYLSAHRGFTSRQVVLINGGANDIIFQLTKAQAEGFTAAALHTAEVAIGQSAIDLASVVATLIENGATHVAVMNLPDIGTTPLGVSSTIPGFSQLLTKISCDFNKTLEAALKQEISGGKVILIDAFSFIDGVIASPQTYGFSVANSGPPNTPYNGMACNLAAQVKRAQTLRLPDPAGFAQALFCSPKTYWTYDADRTFMFADMIHPTTHLNSLFAQVVEQKIAEKRWGWEFSEPTVAAR
jgi:phospholipase/lecithinase/hemolysin